MNSKKAWTSKTLWVNLIAVVGMFVQNHYGSFVMNADDQVTILGAINIILRLVTKKPVVWR